MFRSLTLCMLAVAAATPLSAQSAGDVLETAQAKQAERWQTVDNYTVIQTVNGQQMAMYFEKFEVDGRPAFRAVPMIEYAGSGRQMSAEELRVAAEEADSAAVLLEEVDDQPTEGGGPMFPGMNLSQMARDYGTFMRAGASAKEEAAAGGYGQADAAADVRAMAVFARRATLVGTESVQGRNAYLLRADRLEDMDLPQSDDGTTFTLATMSVWVDTEHYVPLRVVMDGTMQAKGETRPITIERVSEDYRAVGPLYEPHRQVMRISGMMEGMDSKDREKLEKARADMEKAEAELEKMPPAARAMVEGRLKQARAQMEAMAQSGAIESVVEVIEIRINEGPPTGTGVGR